MVGKKVRVILTLLVTTSMAENKINLEDIERDNLRTETTSSSDNLRSGENSQTAVDRPNNNPDEYQAPPQRYHNDGNSVAYVSQQPPEKYVISSEDYRQPIGKYLSNDVDYRQTNRPTKFDNPSNYETPREHSSAYQTEISVGNRYQTIRQKAATEKYLKNSNKETQYVNIPMEHFLSYYPNLALSEISSTATTSNQHYPHHSTINRDRKIAIPIYTPPLRRETIYESTKLNYHRPQSYLSLVTNYPQQTEAILPSRQTEKFVRVTQSSLSHDGPEQPQAEPDQYLREIVHVQPGVSYGSSSSSSGSTNHVQDHGRSNVDPRANAVGHDYASPAGSHQRYEPDYIVDGRYYEFQTSDNVGQTHDESQIYRQQHSGVQMPDDYERALEAPGNGFDLPKLPAGNFKSVGGIRLVPVSNGDVGPGSYRNHLIHDAEPKSLLESYVPSLIIAARDSERYRERPIKLERGFIPSMINFVQTYRKRDVE